MTSFDEHVSALLGIRVRSTESDFPMLTEGTYQGFVKNAHIIDWDVSEHGGQNLKGWYHKRDEFEVI